MGGVKDLVIFKATQTVKKNLNLPTPGREKNL